MDRKALHEAGWCPSPEAIFRFRSAMVALELRKVACFILTGSSIAVKLDADHF